MIDTKYKEHIKSEYERLFNTYESDTSKEPNIHIVMWGDEGLEGYKVVHSVEEMPSLNMWELRARFNSHRNISIYGFRSDTVIKAGKITEELLKSKNVEKLY